MGPAHISVTAPEVVRFHSDIAIVQQAQDSLPGLDVRVGHEYLKRLLKRADGDDHVAATYPMVLSQLGEYRRLLFLSSEFDQARIVAARVQEVWVNRALAAVLVDKTRAQVPPNAKQRVVSRLRARSP